MNKHIDELSKPVAWTDAEELQDMERGYSGYLFKLNPDDRNIDPRRQIMLYSQEYVDALLAKLEAAEKVNSDVIRDANRYRFLRDEDSWGEDSNSWNVETRTGLISSENLMELRLDHFDAAIDARMAASDIPFLNPVTSVLSTEDSEWKQRAEAAEKERDEFRAGYLQNEQVKQELFAQKDLLITANLNISRRAEAAEARLLVPVTFDELADAVKYVTGGIRIEFDPKFDKGHQAVPFMNFNSLSRIVEMFRAAGYPVEGGGVVAKLTEQEYARKPDGGLAEQIEMLEAFAEGDADNTELLMLLIELRSLRTELAAIKGEQQPMGKVVLSDYDNCGYRQGKAVCLHDQADWDNFADGTLLYLHPAPLKE